MDRKFWTDLTNESCGPKILNQNGIDARFGKLRNIFFELRKLIAFSIAAWIHSQFPAGASSSGAGFPTDDTIVMFISSLA